jgi:hypothetical protein
MSSASRESVKNTNKIFRDFQFFSFYFSFLPIIDENHSSCSGSLEGSREERLAQFNLFLEIKRNVSVEVFSKFIASVAGEIVQIASDARRHGNLLFPGCCDFFFNINF